MWILIFQYSIALENDVDSNRSIVFSGITTVRMPNKDASDRSLNSDA